MLATDAACRCRPEGRLGDQHWRSGARAVMCVRAVMCYVCGRALPHDLPFIPRCSVDTTAASVTRNPRTRRPNRYRLARGLVVGRGADAGYSRAGSICGFGILVHVCPQHITTLARNGGETCDSRSASSPPHTIPSIPGCSLPRLNLMPNLASAGRMCAWYPSRLCSRMCRMRADRSAHATFPAEGHHRRAAGARHQQDRRP